MRVVDFDEALRIVLEQAARLSKPRVERVGLLESVGRVLAEEIKADRDQPPFARSTRDGFAVRAADFSSGAELRVLGMVRAGDRWAGDAVGGDEAVQIMTGAPLPEGADAVAMVEFVERGDGWIRGVAGRGLAVGENVVPRGSEARAGQVVLTGGTVMGAAEVAMAATCGSAQTVVFQRPKVAIVATGDELVAVDAVPQEHEIRNSNGYALAAMVTKAGGIAGRLAIARDVREEVWERIAQGRVWDLLILSGGVSMGEYDLVEEVLEEFGAEFFFTGVKMQPGKPVVFGRLPARDGQKECFFFGLPGNPISTQVTFHCFVEPFLRAMAGGVVEGPGFVQATLREDVGGKPGLMRLLPARVSRDRVRPEVRLVGWQGSGDVAANARANCYAVLPGDREGFAAGEVISVLLR
ncbi:gephyrin-like molybdotransferase Glp [Granulicella sibirica]|uniref:Molybdopterin molybdenumtransferase n=1 Tax=Granulicella sibirica TaxID=2479048 RepID=A0A4V1L5V4_9BACT|nr:gephyrin-like molybdotransferase Glp [Granulicella sibirica]RXH57074.1 Molybdopterin biosynthesis protein MoeA [Granulicella sibirica]